MNLKTIILNSELVFRNYIVRRIEFIDKIIIFGDTLDNIIFFYCFMDDGTIIATKELELSRFSYYVDVYNFLAKNYHFYDINNEQKKVLRLVKKH